MRWSSTLLIMAVEILLGFTCGRVLIPYFRKLKTGKLELYIGDRFKKDGSEPLFGGVVVALPLIIGAVLCIGTANRDISFENDGSSKYIAVVIFSLILMALGLVEDYLKDVKKANVGLKLRTKFVLEYAVCLGFLLWLKGFCGEGITETLLPL